MTSAAELPSPQDPPPADRALEPASPSPAARSGPVTNPHLSSKLMATLDALRNDLDQARAMAADYQSQLAGKSNEFAHYKTLFDKTRADMLQLQASITALREERHRLANEAMKAMALEIKLQQTINERDRLASELELLRRTRPVENDALVERLTAEVAALKKELANAYAETDVSYVTDEENSGRKAHREFIRMKF